MIVRLEGMAKRVQKGIDSIDIAPQGRTVGCGV